MTIFILSPEEADKPDTDWSDETLGKYIVGIAIEFCKDTKNNISQLTGVQNSAVLLNNIFSKNGKSNPICFTVDVLTESNTKLNTYCVTVTTMLR
jgi:hypothetical protein